MIERLNKSKILDYQKYISERNTSKDVDRNTD